MWARFAVLKVGQGYRVRRARVAGRDHGGWTWIRTWIQCRPGCDPGVNSQKERELPMSNLLTVLKNEIRRLARSETRSQTAVTKRAAAQHRRDIAELKRVVKDLSNRVGFLESQEKKRVAKPVAEAPAGQVRFSPRWLKVQRNRLGLSASDYGRLVGVSGLTIYNWEGGKAKPRREKLGALAALRGIGKREALKRLEIMGE